MHLLSIETGSTIATTTSFSGRTAECQAEILNGLEGNGLPRAGIEEQGRLIPLVEGRQGRKCREDCFNACEDFVSRVGRLFAFTRLF
jgi:hypothetical protein